MNEKKEPTPLGEILLSNCFIRKADSEESSLRFDIRCPHRTYHLESNNSTELSIWIKALKQAKLGYWNTHPKSSSQSIDSDANQDEVPYPLFSIYYYYYYYYYLFIYYYYLILFNYLLLLLLLLLLL